MRKTIPDYMSQLVSHSSIFYSRWSFVLALATIGIALFEILDFYELPFETKLLSSGTSITLFSGFISIMLNAGYIGLFAAMFLESTSLPIPSEVFLPLAGYFAYLGRMNFPLILAVTSWAGLVGSLAAYFIALKLGSPLVTKAAKKLGIDLSNLQAWERKISGKYGTALILVARFIPGIRSSISLPAGFLRMNVLKFSIVTFIGSLGWSALLVYIGYSAGPLWQTAEANLSNSLWHWFPYILLMSAGAYALVFVTLKSRLFF